jgi:sterol desaturase/sphingolipid hydroxylase (fatty acid hydroxylase superfamily)
MFRVDWLEHRFSRARPWHVAVLWIPVLTWILVRAALDPALPGSQLALLPLAGLLVWTLLEYVLHWGVFHFRADPASELQRDVAFLIHGVHHDYPHDPDRLVMPPLVSALLALVIGLPLHALLGPHLFWPFFAGLVAGYLWYDFTHYAVHHADLRSSAGRWLRRHHLRHHFATPERCYGVTTPLWDLVFGTYPRDAREAVPQVPVEE